jgi:NADP-dependent 3-hydroxy acid dehydrogenase YdfG
VRAQSILCPEAWNCIEVLIKNAALTKMYEEDVKNWEEMIHTNVKGLLYVTRTVVPGIIARGSGHVINLGSIAGHRHMPVAACTAIPRLRRRRAMKMCSP